MVNALGGELPRPVVRITSAKKGYENLLRFLREHGRVDRVWSVVTCTLVGIRPPAETK